MARAINYSQRTIMNMSKEQILQWIAVNLPTKLNIFEPFVVKMNDKPIAPPFYRGRFFINRDE